MKRREVFRQPVTITGGVVLLQSCGSGKERLPMLLKNIVITEQEQETLLAFARMIITIEAPGSGYDETNSHSFLFTMLDNNLSSEQKHGN